MISFATDFAVDPAHGPEDFLRAIASWLLDVERTAIAAEQLQGLPTETSSRINTGGELLQTLIARQPDTTVAGIRYSRQEEHLTWITTVVFSRRHKARENGAGNADLPDIGAPETDTAPTSDAWLGIRIECTSSLPQAHLPVERDPAIVPALLNALGGGQDGPLRVSDQPRLLTGHELPLAADLILGYSDHRLPIVYVSACFQPGHAIDPRRLACRLAGRAHVVVEPGNSFSRQLQALAESTNVYGGTVGIYWPEGGEPRRFYLGTLYQTAAELGDAIQEELHRTLRQRRPLPRCTWAHLREQVSQNTIAALKSAGSLSIDDCIRSLARKSPPRSSSCRKPRKRSSDCSRNCASVKSAPTTAASCWRRARSATSTTRRSWASCWTPWLTPGSTSPLTAVATTFSSPSWAPTLCPTAWPTPTATP